MSLIEFDVWLPPVDLSTAPDARLSTDDSLTDAGFNPVFYGEGDGFLELHIDHADTQYLQRRGFVRAVRTDTDEPIFDFFLEEANTKVLAKNTADKVIRWSGRGSLYILDRYRLGQAVYAPGQPNRGSVSVIDYWTWINISPGGILTRTYEEGFYHPVSFYANATIDFDRVTDSDGNTWVDVTDYQTRIGTSGLQVAADMMRMGLMVRTLPAADSILIQAFRDFSFRVDRTGAVGGIGIVRFAAGVNIAVELPQKIAALQERSHTLTRRQDGQYATETLNGSGEPYMDFMEVPYTSDPDAVEAAVGTSHLNRQKQSLVAVVQHKIGPGGEDGAEGYFPSPSGGDYWTGDLVTVHTGTGEYDLNEQTLEVAGIRYFLRGADWMVQVQLGAQALTASGAPVGIGSGGPTVVRPSIQLCQADAISPPTMTEGYGICDDTEISPTFGLTVQGGTDSALIILHAHDPTESSPNDFTSAEWRTEGDASPTQAFTRIHGYDSAGFSVWSLEDPDPAINASADVLVNTDGLTRFWGLAYVTDLDTVDPIRGFYSATGTSDTASVTVDTEPGDLVLMIGVQLQNNFTPVEPTAGGGLTTIGTDTDNPAFGQRDGTGGFGYLVADASSETPSWTFNASRPWWALAVVLKGSGTGFDGPESLVGTAPRAARCDHNHLVENLLTTEDDTELVLKPDGAGGVEWGADAGAIADILDIPTAETDTALVLKPDGAGGVEWGTDATGGGGSIPNLFVGSYQALTGYGSPSITTGLSANRAYLAKFIPSQDVTVGTAYWNCTTSNGNLDFGIYDASFDLLASTGSFASPGTGSRSQAFSGAATVDLVAGTVYYLAMTASSTTLRVPTLVPVALIASPWNLIGKKASALPLPDPGTPDDFDGGFAFPVFFFD